MKVLKFITASIICISLVIISSPDLFADETSEAILKLLIKKGIITQREVDEIKSEVARSKPAAPRDLEERVSKLEKSTSWVRKTKLKGDVRVRNEYIHNDVGQDNNRQRLRVRLGAKSQLNDAVKVAVGIATGSSDSPTSTNQTLEREFQSKPIWLDYGYASYDPYDWLHLIGGKFKSPFFHTDMLFDGDIRFDGVAGKVKRDINPDSDMPTTAYATLGYFPLDDANTTAGDDIYLVAGQIGTKTEFADGDVKLKTGLAYYNFEHLRGVPASSLAEERGTNTYNRGYTNTANSTLATSFNVLSPTLKLTFANFFGTDAYWGIIGEYANNLATTDIDEAWRAGLWVGDKKVKKENQWKLLGQYSEVEADSFFDAFPDGDFNGAGTNAKGWELIFNYALADNVILGLDYYKTEEITGADSDQQIIQTDLIFKF